MVGMNGIKAYNAYAKKPEKAQDDKANKAEEVKEVDNKQTKAGNYGKTIGKPQLSEKASKYYDQLKKKFGNFDFILVSSDEMENAKANAAKYANRFKTVVLIDEAKIEKMATDENFRKKYEGILTGAASSLDQLKKKMEQSGANVKGFGMQVNDDGTTSFFAVLKKSSADQKARIERKAETKRAEKKAAEKKASKEKQQERIKNLGEKNHIQDEDDSDIITAGSLEELMKKIEDYGFSQLSDNVLTETEKQIGQSIDFRG